MSKGDYLTAILRSPKTEFTSKDIALLWGEQSSNSARVRLNYYVRKGDLYRIRRGLYAKDKNYNKIELATRIFTPSYVSFETVLAKEGLIFQFYSQIFIASYLTREINIDGQAYCFKQMKRHILTNPDDIEHKDEISIATKERAFLDILYVNNDYYFDNLRGLNWDQIFKILPIYKNRRMVKKVNDLYKKRLI
jgi:predicted transcriptional regulator of viral defense system